MSSEPPKHTHAVRLDPIQDLVKCEFCDLAIAHEFFHDCPFCAQPNREQLGNSSKESVEKVTK
jgi:hypothetical protein